MLTEVSAARDGVVHAERVRGQGQAIKYYLAGPTTAGGTPVTYMDR